MKRKGLNTKINKGEAKFEKVMREFGEGKLKSHDKVVTDPKQAVAIAYSEAREVSPRYGKSKGDKYHQGGMYAGGGTLSERAKALFSKSKELAGKGYEATKKGYKATKAYTEEKIHDQKKKIALQVIEDTKDKASKSKHKTPLTEYGVLRASEELVEDKYVGGGRAGQDKIVPYVVQGKRIANGQIVWELIGTLDRKPKAGSAEAERNAYNDSLKKGGANEHLGDKYRVSDVRIVNQKTGEEVDSYKAPMFEVIESSGGSMENGGEAKVDVRATSKMNTKDGEIIGKVIWNPFWKKYQVYIDGSLYGEHNDEFEAIKELKNSGFKDIDVELPFSNGGEAPTETSDQVNKLIEFVNQNEKLSAEKDTIYGMESSEGWDKARLHQQFKRIFSYMAETSYNKENPDNKIELTEEERNVFAGIYAGGNEVQIPVAVIEESIIEEPAIENNPDIEGAKRNLSEATETLRATDEKVNELENDIDIATRHVEHASDDLEGKELPFKNGGIPNNYKGKTSKQVWSEWIEPQRDNFLKDHFPTYFDTETMKGRLMSELGFKVDEWEKNREVRNKYSASEYDNLPEIIKDVLASHVSEGQYKNGGDTKQLPIGTIYKLKNGSYYTVISIRKATDSSYSYASDEKGNPIKGGRIISSNYWLGETPEVIGKIELDSVSKTIAGDDYTYYLSGNKDVDTEMASLDDRWRAFAKNATKKQRAIFDEQEDQNAHYANAKMLTEWFDEHKEGGSLYDKGGEVDGINVDEVVRHFIIAGLWASYDDNEENLDANYGIEDVSKKSIKEIREKTIKFLKENIDIIKRLGLSEESIGHDLFLDSQGHGVGFWDRGYGDDGDKLSKSAEQIFPSDQPYVGDDKKIYFSSGGSTYDGGGKIKGKKNKFVITSSNEPYEIFIGNSIGGHKIQWVEKWRKPIIFSTEAEANEFNKKINMNGKVVKAFSGGSMENGGEAKRKSVVDYIFENSGDDTLLYYSVDEPLLKNRDKNKNKIKSVLRKKISDYDVNRFHKDYDLDKIGGSMEKGEEVTHEVWYTDKVHGVSGRVFEKAYGLSDAKRIESKAKKAGWENIEIVPVKKSSAGSMENGGGVGEDNYRIIRKRSDNMVDNEDIDGVLQAMIDSGLKDSDLHTPETKTGTQYLKAKDKKADEILAIIEKKYKGKLKGNQPDSIIRTLVDRATSFDAKILEDYKSYGSSMDKGGKAKPAPIPYPRPFDDGGSTKPKKMTPEKKKLMEKIEKAERALAGTKLSPKSRAFMQAQLESYQKELVRRIPVSERIMQSKGRFFIEIPAEYRGKMNTLLQGADLKPRYGVLDGKMRITVDNKAKLHRLYKIYSDMLIKKSQAVPPLEEISGKPSKVKRQS